MAPELNILDTGNGLFETHVHIEDVQKVIHQQLNTEAVLKSSSKFTVIGDGNGFMSRVILVDADWSESSEELPTRFILKITSCLHVQSLMDKMKENGTSFFSAEKEEFMWNMFETEAKMLHNREINLYKILEKWNMRHITLNPKIYFYQQFEGTNRTKGFIGMEYVDNPIVRHLNTAAKCHELYPVLRSIATIQANSLNFTNEDRKSIEGFDFQNLAGEMMSEDGLKGMFMGTALINEEKLGEKCRKALEIGTKLINLELTCNLNKHVGIKNDVLVHGDLWAANILWEEENDEFKVQKVIDYQLVHMGNPAEDLVRLFLSTLSGSDSSNHWEELCEKFYEYFLAALDGREIPYTLEQLKESYRMFYTTGAIFVLPLFGPIAEAKLKYANPEDVERNREVLTDKALHLLDDLIKFHEYSMNNHGK